MHQSSNDKEAPGAVAREADRQRQTRSILLVHRSHTGKDGLKGSKNSADDRQGIEKANSK